eukprot:UN00696
MPVTEHDLDLKTLKFQEYHIRSAQTLFNPKKSYHATRANLLNLVQLPQEPKLFKLGDKKFVVRGGIAYIQDFGSLGQNNYHFGPIQPDQPEPKKFTFAN